jgi:CDGSH-type Zn-finger protein
MALAYEDLQQPYIVKQVTKEVAYCMCGRTKNPPFCDDSHVVTSILPHVIEVEAPTTMAICSCWKSKTRPFCDGTHGKLVTEKPRARSDRDE